MADPVFLNRHGSGGGGGGGGQRTVRSKTHAYVLLCLCYDMFMIYYVMFCCVSVLVC